VLASDSARSAVDRLMMRLDLTPTQDVEQGTEPLLVAAVSPGAVSGAYYGPSRWLETVGPAKLARIPRRALDEDVAARLWTTAEELTGVSLPAVLT
jgi:hypothetical protein